MNHVRIGEDPARPLTRETPYLARTVAVVRTRRDIGQCRHCFGECHRGSQLVMAERLGRRQIQRPRAWIRFQGRQYRQLVGQRLSRCGASAEHDVPSVVCEIGGRELMRPQRLNTAINERPHHIWVRPLRPRLRPALACGQVCDVPQGLLVRIRAFDRTGKQCAAEFRPRI
jgi:hypothetical protein